MSGSRAGKPRAEEPAPEEHAHHWLISGPDGPSSEAVCKECGERRDFQNTLARRTAPWANRSSAAKREDSGTTPTDS